MIYKSNEQGVCPYCNSTNLAYGPIELNDDLLAYYPWTCEDCSHSGYEYYKLNFIGHNDEHNNIIEL